MPWGFPHAEVGENRSAPAPSPWSSTVPIYDSPEKLASMLGSAINQPALSVTAEVDGSRVYVNLPDGSIMRLDVRWVSRVGGGGAADPLTALYVDDVPVLFGCSVNDPMLEHIKPLGARVRISRYDGPYPLTGDTLARSVSLLESEIEPLLKAAGWV